MKGARAALVLRDVHIGDRRASVLIRGGQVAACGAVDEFDPTLPAIDGDGGALIPGLHDHHLHLLALAAERDSVALRLGDTGSSMRRRLRAARSTSHRWVRVTGYHESIAGHLDRHLLDAFEDRRPVRVQHRSGALWVLNSRALEEVGARLDVSSDVERDRLGEPNGRLWRYDARLRTLLPPGVPDVGAVMAELIAVGITGVTDATPDLDGAGLALLAVAASAGPPPEVQLLGMDLDVSLPPRFRHGPRKIPIADHRPPGLPELVATIRRARAGCSRPIALHCVTAETLAVVVAALEIAGSTIGDRIEHASVVPFGMEADLARLGVTVVTQPGFVAARGDEYSRLPEHERAALYPWARLRRAGVPVAPSSDAPYGPVDPWRVIAAAQRRATPGGALIGAEEAVTRSDALNGYLAPLEHPGGPPRRVVPGTPADLVLLSGRLTEALESPTAPIRAVVRGGEPVVVAE